MGYDFTFLNVTNNSFSKELKETYLTKNIHSGNSKSHILNIVKYVIKYNNWKESDIILVSSWAHEYKINIKQGIFIDVYYDEDMSDNCNSTHCTLCINKNSPNI